MLIVILKHVCKDVHLHLIITQTISLENAVIIVHNKHMRIVQAENVFKHVLKAGMVLIQHGDVNEHVLINNLLINY
jgi:hypothetical protein